MVKQVLWRTETREESHHKHPTIPHGHLLLSHPCWALVLEGHVPWGQGTSAQGQPPAHGCSCHTKSHLWAELYACVSCPRLVYALSLVKVQSSRGSRICIYSSHLSLKSQHWDIPCACSHSCIMDLAKKWLHKYKYMSSFCTQIEKTGKFKSNSTLGKLFHDHPTPTAHGMLLRHVLEHCQSEEGIDLHLPLPGIEELCGTPVFLLNCYLFLTKYPHLLHFLLHLLSSLTSPWALRWAMNN